MKHPDHFFNNPHSEEIYRRRCALYKQILADAVPNFRWDLHAYPLLEMIRCEIELERYDALIANDPGLAAKFGRERKAVRDALYKYRRDFCITPYVMNRWKSKVSKEESFEDVLLNLIDASDFQE